MRRFDVVIVGGGVIGSAIAWRLAHYNVSAAVLDKASDVVRGTSGRNSGVVHAAFNPPTGSHKASLNLDGKNRFEEFCRTLGVPYRRTGKLVIAQDDSQIPQLEALVQRGRANGVDDLTLIDSQKASELVPGLMVRAAMLSPSTAITCPFTLTIVLAESAACAGVKYLLRTKVFSLSRISSGYELKTSAGIIRAKAVVNAAGLGAVALARTLGLPVPRYRPVRGEYLILDREAESLLPMPVYPLPPNEGKSLGIHLTPSIDGTVLVGPTAEGVIDGENTRSTKKVINKLMKTCDKLLPGLRNFSVIHCFSGIRPTFERRGDFIIETPATLPGFVNLLGIESPGLTAAPAIARMVVEDLLKEGRVIGEKWSPRTVLPKPRRPGPRVRDLELDEWERLWKQDPDYGEIVCRCEKVTRAEVKRALDNPLEVRTLLGLKLRTRVTAGRCQGGFCMLRVVGSLEKTTGAATSATLSGDGSSLFTGRTKSLHMDKVRSEKTES